MTATMQESAAPPRVKQAPAAIAVSGIVDMAGGQAFVRTSGYRRSPADVSVSAGQIRQYGLRKGDKIEGAARSEGARVPMGPGPNGTGRGQLNPAGPGQHRQRDAARIRPGPVRTSTT